MRDKCSHYNDEPTNKDSCEVPSKSAKKREMLALQALGQEIAALSKKQFQKIIFPEENLLDALESYRSIPTKKREARRQVLKLLQCQHRAKTTYGSKKFNNKIPIFF